MNRANMTDSERTKAAQIDPLATGENVRGVVPLIAESWARCRALGFDPKLAPDIAVVDPGDSGTALGAKP